MTSFQCSLSTPEARPPLIETDVSLSLVKAQFSCAAIGKPADLSAAWTEEQRILASNAIWPHTQHMFKETVCYLSPVIEMSDQVDVTFGRSIHIMLVDSVLMISAT